ncbi:MAG: sulfatase-like hydrolase/transferase [Sediminibacterium sp.]
MKKIFDLFNLKQLSFILIALPYLAFNSRSILLSPFFSIFNSLLLIVILLIIDLTIKLLLENIHVKLQTTISLFSFFVFSIFFYGFYATFFIKRELQILLDVSIRGRIILEFITILGILTIFLFRNKRIKYKYINTFFVLFSTIAGIFSITSFKAKNENLYKSNYIKINNEEIKNKSVILIVADEYSSPDELYKVHKDSSIHNFSNRLSSNKWIIKKNFYSYETSTIHSLSSLFNFNLSVNYKYAAENPEIIGTSKLVRATIADSLKKKNISIINFGIFHIGLQPYFKRLYLYPTSFIEAVLIKSIYYTIKTYTGNFNESGIINTFYPMEAHNEYIINHMVDSLQSTHNKSFIYVHLYMPHIPMKFGNEFKYRSKYNLSNYKAYWEFTNQKIEKLLKQLTKENKYKIILTGDHGYRDNKRINPHSTFGAFYGFSQESINKIKSVQDLGSLINGSY